MNCEGNLRSYVADLELNLNGSLRKINHTVICHGIFGKPHPHVFMKLKDAENFCKEGFLQKRFKVDQWGKKFD